MTVSNSSNHFVEFWTEERCFITEILNTGDLPDFSLAIARVAPSETTQLHSLINVNETYIICKGSGLVNVNGKLRQLNVGDHCVISAGTPQQITNLSDEDDLEFYCHCMPKFVPSCYKSLE